MLKPEPICIYEGNTWKKTAMEERNYYLSEILEAYPNSYFNDALQQESGLLFLQLLDSLRIGETYYYVYQHRDQQLSRVDPKICSIHGLKESPKHIEQIMACIDPKEIPFVLQLEEQCLALLAELGQAQVKHYKMCYAIRMRLANGDYAMFYHQVIPLDLDESGKLRTSFHMICNMEHITSKNNFIGQLIGLTTCFKTYSFDLSHFMRKSGQSQNPLTSREQGILHFIAQGYSSIKIAKLLGISELTVRVHRKNMLKKTKTSNSSSLISHCLAMGWL